MARVARRRGLRLTAAQRLDRIRQCATRAQLQELMRIPRLPGRGKVEAEPPVDAAAARHLQGVAYSFEPRRIGGLRREAVVFRPWSSSRDLRDLEAYLRLAHKIFIYAHIGDDQQIAALQPQMGNPFYNVEHLAATPGSEPNGGWGQTNIGLAATIGRVKHRHPDLRPLYSRP